MILFSKWIGIIVLVQAIKNFAKIGGAYVQVKPCYPIGN